MIRKRLSRSLLPLLGVVLIVVLASQARAFVGSKEPAPTPSSSAAPSPRSRVIAEGRVTTYPGMEVAIGTDYSGIIDRVLVQERELVKKGQLIAELRNDEMTAALNEARARENQASADVRLHEVEVQRARVLWEKEVGSRQAFDSAVRDYEASVAGRATAAATVNRLQATLARTRIYSPIDGVVLFREVDGGEAVESGAVLLTVANISRLRVEAEVDEYDVAHVAEGHGVLITAEGYPGKAWKGHVEEVPASVTPRKLRSQDPARPSDTSILLVKIAVDEQAPLKLGQRVDIEVRPEGK